MGRFIDITGAPIASDFQEMPLDFMAKALSAKQASYDKQELEASALPGLFGEGFIATKGYKDILTKELNPKLAEWSKRAIADPEGVGRDITKYKSQLANDVRYRLLTADTAKKAEYLKDLKETNKLGKAYEKAFDYTTGQYKGPIDPDKLLKGEVVGDLEDFYGNPIYGDVHKDYTENLKNIKEISIEDVSTLFPGLNQYGDQLKTTKTFKVDSNSIYDPTVIGKDENGNPITIGEATKRKVHQVSDAILANNSVAAQYANTPLSPFRILEGALPEDASIIDKGRAYGEYVFSPMSKQSRTNKNEITSFGTNANVAKAAQNEVTNIAIPGLFNIVKTPEEYGNLMNFTKAAATSSRTAFIDRIQNMAPAIANMGKKFPGALTDDKLRTVYDAAQLKLKTLKPGDPDRIYYEDVVNKGNGYFAEKLKFNNLMGTYADEAISKINATNPSLKVDRNDVLSSLSDIYSTVDFNKTPVVKINTITGKVAEEGDKNTISVRLDILPNLATKASAIEVPTYSLMKANGSALSPNISASITTLEGMLMSGTAKLEGQNPNDGRGPDGFVRDKLQIKADEGYSLNNVYMDKYTGQMVASYKADKSGKVANVAVVDNSLLKSLKENIYSDLTKTTDGSARDFGKRGLFNEYLRDTGVYGDWADLQQQKEGTITIPQLGSITKASNTKGDSYYVVTDFILNKKQNTNSADGAEKLLSIHVGTEND